MDLSAGERDPVKGADWLEAQTVYSRRGFAHKDDIVDAALGSGDLIEDEDQGDHGLASPTHDRSLAAQRLADNTSMEIERRIELCGELYPFSFSRGRLVWRERDKWADPYIVCLLVSDRDQYKPGDDAGKVFEHLTTLAVGAFLDGDAIRFGAPRDTMPSPITEAVAELAALTASQAKSGWELRPRDQDIGLDVVGWKTFPDRHNNGLQIYAQCATGEGWLQEKSGQPNIELWSGILLWGLPPVPALAIPYVADREGDWAREMAGRLLLDRLRIVSAFRGRQLLDGPVNWYEWAEERASLGGPND